MTPQRSALELFVDATVVVPVTVGARLVEQLPKAVKRTQQEITFARFIGKMVVDTSVRQLRRRFTGPPAEIDPVLPSNGTDSHTLHRDEGSRPFVDDKAVAESSSSNGLVLPDYDHLPASHVVAKLESLDQAERDAIERYERANRARRTVLGKLDQLRVS